MSRGAVQAARVDGAGLLGDRLFKISLADVPADSCVGGAAVMFKSRASGTTSMFRRDLYFVPCRYPMTVCSLNNSLHSWLQGVKEYKRQTCGDLF